MIGKNAFYVGFSFFLITLFAIGGVAFAIHGSDSLEGYNFLGVACIIVLLAYSFWGALSFYKWLKKMFNL